MIHIEHVNKIYKTGDVETAALKDIELTIQDGAFVVILGPSGSGYRPDQVVPGTNDRVSARPSRLYLSTV